MKILIIKLKKDFDEIRITFFPPKKIYSYKNIRVELLSAFAIQYRIFFGIFALVGWVTLFSMGLTINSTLYRQAIAFNYAEFWDYAMTILTFTPTNVGILAALAGLAGGVSSNLSANNLLKRRFLKEITENRIVINGTESFNNVENSPFIDKVEDNPANKVEENAENKDITIEEKRIIYMTERPMVSMLRGFMVYLIFVAGSYITSFNDITSESVKNKDMSDSSAMAKNVIINLKIDSLKKVQQKLAFLNKNEPNSPKINALYALKVDLKSWVENNVHLPDVANIPGLSIGSYFKFAVTVSLLAFIVGYDPSRLEGMINRFGIGDSPKT